MNIFNCIFGNRSEPQSKSMYNEKGPPRYFVNWYTAIMFKFDYYCIDNSGMITDNNKSELFFQYNNLEFDAGSKTLTWCDNQTGRFESKTLIMCDEVSEEEYYKKLLELDSQRIERRIKLIDSGSFVITSWKKVFEEFAVKMVEKHKLWDVFPTNDSGVLILDSHLDVFYQERWNAKAYVYTVRVNFGKVSWINEDGGSLDEINLHSDFYKCSLINLLDNFEKKMIQDSSALKIYDLVKNL